MKTKLGLLIATLFICNPSNSFADYVRSADVVAGEFEVHNISVLENDSEDHFENELELAYGFNNWFEVELGLVSEKAEHENFDAFTGAELGLKFELSGEGEYVPATALFLSYDYTHEKGEADEIGAMAIFGKKFGKFDNLLNAELSTQVGGAAEGGVELTLKARSVYELCEKIKLGAEYFGKFGEIGGGHDWNEQGHQLGPVLMYKASEDVHASLAYLAGISDEAPESAIKLEIGFHF